MPEWLIKSRDQDYEVRVGESTREHADSVLRSLINNQDVPSDLDMEEVRPPEPVRTPWWKRL